MHYSLVDPPNPIARHPCDEVSLGWLLEEIYMTWAHLEKKRTRLRLYTISLEEYAYRLTPKSPSSWHRSLATSLIFYDHVNPATRRTISQSAGGKLRDKKAEESWALLEDLAFYDNESWNDPRDLAKPVKAISLPQDVPSTSDRRLIELENQVQCLMEAHLAPKSSVQGTKSLLHARSVVVPTTLNIAWKIPSKLLSITHPRVYTKREASGTLSNPSKTTLVTPIIGYGKVTQTLGLVSNFMASQDARLSKFEADFKQQQGKMTNKIDTFLKAINDRMMGELSSDTIKNPKLSDNSTSLRKFVSLIRSLINKLGSRSSDVKFVCTKDNYEDVMFIELIKKYDVSSEEELGEDESTETGGLEAEYFNIFPTRSELTYHKYLMSGPVPSLFLRNPIITEGCPSNLKIPCNIGHIMKKQLEPREDPEGVRGISNFTGRMKRMHIFIGNFTYVSDFMIVEDISSIIDPRISQVVLGKSFVEISNMTHDLSLRVVKFTNETNEVAYKIPHTIEQYNLLSDLEKEHTK
ncbi:hypothetical protein Tco_0750173 [Tanacetum coccineum]|uniref:MAK10-like protein n=1 Tax=Tanacetum coccineum TaxID=301880 RepID=A0ABQ4Z389_9ASTR